MTPKPDPPPPIWTPGNEPLMYKRTSLLGSPPKPEKGQDFAMQWSAGEFNDTTQPRKGPSTPIGDAPDTQSEGSDKDEHYVGDEPELYGNGRESSTENSEPLCGKTNTPKVSNNENRKAIKQVNIELTEHKNNDLDKAKTVEKRPLKSALKKTCRINLDQHDNTTAIENNGERSRTPSP